MVVKRKSGGSGADVYLRLVRDFPLRPIRSEAEYDRAVEILKELVAKADVGLSAGESDYADALGHFIGVYESAHYQLTRPGMHTPVDRLKYLLREHGMKTADLGKLLGSGQGQASLILNGKRELSKANIRALAERFKVSPALFL
jgi:HTH-type transcriptional regulator/antitoxin HigA